MFSISKNLLRLTPLFLDSLNHGAFPETPPPTWSSFYVEMVVGTQHYVCDTNSGICVGHCEPYVGFFHTNEDAG